MFPDTFENQAGPAKPSGESLYGVHRVLAVLTADLVGYSELVFADAHTGFAILHKTRAILADCISRDKGKILQTPGDFVLATFDDFNDALRAAVAAQERLLKHHKALEQRSAGHWKIGIAYGDVYAIGDDYYGNAINVAARLQALAAPGEIYFTGKFDNLPTLQGTVIQDIGLKKLKNIEEPIRIHCALLPTYNTYTQTAGRAFSTPPKLLKHLSKPVLRLEPFDNINQSNEGGLFGKALVGEIHLILSRLSNTISVTDPNIATSSHQDYVLSGAIQSRGPYARIMARLTSCTDGLTIWEERFECDLDLSFDVQDQISQEIVSALQLRLTEGDQAQLWRRGTKSGKAWEYFQRGLDAEKHFTRQGHEKAKELYAEALRIDPKYFSASVALAFCYLDQVRLGWSANSEEPIAAAEELCERARQLASQQPDVSALQAFLFFFQKHWGEARAEMQRAVELAPHSPQIIGYQGALSDLMGDYEAAIHAYIRALSLSAHSPAWIPSNLGLSYLAVGNVEEAENIYREVLKHHPNYVRAWIGLAVALNRQGKGKEAKQVATTVLSLDPTFSSEVWGKSRPFHDDELLNAFIKDLQAVMIP